MAEAQNIIKFNDFSAGLSESKTRGVFGSYAKAVGVDIHSDPGIVKAQQALAKDSALIVVDKILASVHTSSGHSYHFGDAGKIYKRTSGGTWSVLQTVTGTPKLLGAAEHSNGKVYFTYSNKVGTLLVTDDTFVESAHTLTNTNTNYGPVIYHEKQDKILIGNQDLVAQVNESGAFTAAGLDLNGKYEVRDITWRDIDVLIGATQTGHKFSRIFQWDGTASSWTFSWFIHEEIKWMLNNQEAIYVMAGEQGRLYDFSKGLKNPIKQVPGDFSSNARFETNQNSKVMFRGFLHFGLYEQSGTPFPVGVYTWGTRNIRTLPEAMNSAEYVISPNKTTAVEIGAISTDGANLFVAWKDGSTYGVDKIDFTARFGSAFIEFLVINESREIDKSWEQFPVSFRPLPASTTVELKQARDYASSFTSVATASTDNSVDDEQQFSGESVDDSRVIQLRLDFGISSNDTPEVEAIGVVFRLNDFE